jgi:hypothetical protein
MLKTLCAMLCIIMAIFLLSCAGPQTSNNVTVANNNKPQNTNASTASADDEKFLQQLKNELDTAKSKMKTRSKDDLKDVAAAKPSTQPAPPNTTPPDKVAQWQLPWTDGDCALAGYPAPGGGLPGPKLVFRSNGTGYLSSQGRSTDDDDEYLMRFEVKDAAGNILFYLPGTIHIGTMDIPYNWKLEISDPNIWYGFSPGFSFPADKFDKIAIDKLDAYAGC